MQTVLTQTPLLIEAPPMAVTICSEARQQLCRAPLVHKPGSGTILAGRSLAVRRLDWDRAAELADPPREQ
jgi:hypothetical protein